MTIIGSVVDRILNGGHEDPDEPERPSHESQIPESPMEILAWDEIVGQDHVKRALRTMIDAAKTRGEPLDHLLLKGPPGLGKTAIASATAAEFGGIPLVKITGPQLNRDTLENFVQRIAEACELSPLGTCIVFIDEIHGIDTKTATILLPLLEYFQYYDQILPRFTVIGATTDPAKLLGPFRRRFQIQFQLEYYKPEEVKLILHRRLKRVLKLKDAELNELIAEPEALDVLAGLCRGTPWRAVVFASRLKDFLTQRDAETGKLVYAPINLEAIAKMREALDIDEFGLERIDRKVLEVMLMRFLGRPTGIKSIAAAVGESPKTMEEIIEPDLFRMGYVNREPRGRTLTVEGITAVKTMQARAAGLQPPKKRAAPKPKPKVQSTDLSTLKPAATARPPRRKTTDL